MKMKKIISLVSAFAMMASMLVSFATVSSASETFPANIDVVAVEADGYYNVDVIFSLEDGSLNITEETSGRDKLYSGTGLQAFTVEIKDIPDDAIYDGTAGVVDHIFAAVVKVTLNEGTLMVGDLITLAEKAAGTDGSAKLFTIYTNYSSADKTAEEVEAIFSNFGGVNFKTVQMSSVKKGTDISALEKTTYANSAPGVIHVDAQYGVKINGVGGEPEATATPEVTASPEPTTEPTTEPTATPVPEKIPSASAPGQVNGVIFGDSYVGDESAADESAAVAAGLMSDGINAANKVLWTVTANGVTKTYTQDIATIEGEARVKVGLVIFGLAQSAIEAVTAVLQ